MKRITSDVVDVPPPVPALDRRRTPDRRTDWRGGRRDSDWQDRPIGGLDRLEERRRRRGSLVRKAMSVLSLW